LTHEYAIVAQFQKLGNLRTVISNHMYLTWEDIIHIFFCVSFGLQEIHQKDYYHKDFHSGNILSRIGQGNFIWSYISDFGLCRPAHGEGSEYNKVYGVLPF